MQLHVSSKRQDGTINRAEPYFIQQAESCLFDGFILPDCFHHDVRLGKRLQRGPLLI